MRKILYLFLTLSILYGCGFKNEEKNNSFLKIGNNSFSLNEFKIYMNDVTGSEIPVKNSAVIFDLLDQFIDEQIIMIKACENSGIDFRSMPHTERKKILESFIRKNVSDKIAISDSEAFNLEFVNTDENFPALKIKAWRIQVENKDNLAAILDACKAENADFAELAEKYSAGPDKGKLLSYERGSLPQEIEEVLFSLKEGEVSDPIETSYGYHIFKVEKAFTNESSNDEQDLVAIKSNFFEERAKDALSDYIKDLKREYPIKIDTERLIKEFK